MNGLNTIILTQNKALRLMILCGFKLTIHAMLYQIRIHKKGKKPKLIQVDITKGEITSSSFPLTKKHMKHILKRFNSLP